MSETSRSSESGTSVPQNESCNASGRTMGGMCLNWKVIAGVAAVGIGIWAMAPGLVAGIAPLLIFAICPLSMWLMMRGMSGTMGSKASASPGATGPSGPGDLAALKAEHARVAAKLEALERDVEQTNATAATPEAASLRDHNDPTDRLG